MLGFGKVQIATGITKSNTCRDEDRFNLLEMLGTRRASSRKQFDTTNPQCLICLQFERSLRHAP